MSQDKDRSFEVKRGDFFTILQLLKTLYRRNQCTLNQNASLQAPIGRPSILSLQTPPCF